jgi:hypothetical protein
VYAAGLQQALNAELAAYLGDGGWVFRDDSGLKYGQALDHHLAAALHRSAAMIPMCLPVYFDAQVHPWCAWEWATMEDVLARRPACAQEAIFPILLRQTHPLPPVVSSRLYADVSAPLTGATLPASFWHRTKAGRAEVNKLRDRVLHVLDALRRGAVGHGPGGGSPAGVSPALTRRDPFHFTSAPPPAFFHHRTPP